MNDPHVPKHWIVAPWLASADTDNHPYGVVQPPDPRNMFGDVESAKACAKRLAAAAPGSVYVVYMALWYSFTDETPVNLLPIMGVAV